MSTERNQRIASSDRSMEPSKADRSELFFFPKRNPPVSIRAASLEEAERKLSSELLETPNPKEA